MAISQITNKDASLDTLTVLEKLLLSQIIYEKGTKDWSIIADKLSKHRLLTTSTSSSSSTPVFQKHVKKAYELLMEDIGIDIKNDKDSLTINDGNPKSTIHLTLAKKHYLDRLAELRRSLSDEEEKFRKLVNEIRDIKNGKWDDKISSDEKKSVVIDGDDVDVDVSPTPLKKPKRKQPDDNEIEQVNQNASENEKDKGHDGDVDVEQGPSTSPLSTPVDEDQTDDAKDSSSSAAKMDVDDEIDKPVTTSSTRKTRHTSHQQQAEKSPTPPLPSSANEQELSPPDTSSSERKRKRDGATTTTTTATTNPLSPSRSPIKSSTTPTTESSSPKPISAQTSTSADTSRGGTKKKDKDDDAATPTTLPDEPTEKDRPNSKRYQRALSQILHQILELSSASPFREPVRVTEAPDYSKLINKPMDLKSIGKRIRDGTISTSEELKRDVLLIFANAVMFNKRNGEIGQRALETYVESERLINVFDSAEYQL